MSTIGRLLRYASRHTGTLLIAFCLALVGSVIELAKPWPGKLVIDYGLEGHPLPPLLAGVTRSLPGAGTRHGLIAWSVAGALLLVWAGAAISFSVLSLIVRICQRMVCEIASDAFEKVQRLSLSFHGKHAVGDLVERLSGDVFVIHSAISQVAVPGSTSLFLLVGMFFVLTRIDPALSLVAFVLVPLLAAALLAFLKPMHATTARQYQIHGSMMAFIEQSLTAIRAVQGFAREDYMQRRLTQRAQEVADAYGSATVVASGYQQVTTVMTGSAAVAILWFGSERVIAGRMSVGDLWVFLGYLAALYGPVYLLATAIGSAVQVVARGRRVFEVMDARDEVPEAKHALYLDRAKGEVVFRNVSFGYRERNGTSGGNKVLQNVSFSASPGLITAIVGPSGAGKTTLVSLISRFYDPQEGEILLDGHDVRTCTLKSLRENVSMVLQDPFLFAMSVADNIAFGKPGASREEIVRAAQIARAHDFIMRLPQAYDTILSEKRVSLSGGERQRISIARALLKNAPILILDEPTSSLDAQTEALIFDGLTEAMRNKTVFIISHRLSTIRRADQILTITDGEIVGRGTHERLIAIGSTRN